MLLGCISISLPMKMEPIVSSETSAIKSQTPGNYPKRNKLHLQHGESLRTSFFSFTKSAKTSADYIRVRIRFENIRYT